MTSSESFDKAKSILWDDSVGPTITTDTKISEQLGTALTEAGVKVVRIGRKPHSKNKFILFDIEVFQVAGTDRKFVSEKDARDWEAATRRGLNTMMKAPNEAFVEKELQLVVERIWWSQALTLAFRLDANIDSIVDKILVLNRNIKVGSKFGI